MKILIDLNLSPEWKGVLNAGGHAATHWIDVGDAKATDAVIMRWASENGHVVFTHDLDFADLLAATAGCEPSVILVRTRDPLPESLGSRVLGYLKQFETVLVQGAIVVVEPDRARARVLPITRE